jgi:transposase
LIKNVVAKSGEVSSEISLNVNQSRYLIAHDSVIMVKAGHMGRPAPKIQLSTEEKETLLRWMRSSKTEQRLVQRARVILLAASGMNGKQIALKMQTRAARISKWLRRFAKDRIAALNDSARSGEKRRKYTGATEERILKALDEPPPAGYSRWNGRLLAEHLGQVSKDQVWRVMRKHDLHLERRQSWCVSTDPEFSRKAADVVGLYLNPPENALVLCIDEKPCIQALERAQGWIRLPNGRALSGFTHEYKRHGTTTLFAALNVASGLVHAGHYRRRRRREFLDFMNELISKYPDKELHVVLDNLNTHKPKEDRWLKAHPNVHLHFIPTHSSWLNQIECWFSILSRSTLRGASFTSVRMLVEAIEAFVASWNQKAAPFEWTIEGAILQRLRGVERAVGSDLSVLDGGRLVGLPVLQS